MFTSELTQKPTSNLVKTYQGVDLSNFTCYKLEPNAMYQKYDVSDLPYVIDAVQKGQKPHTKIGLARLKKKNIKKLAQQRLFGKKNSQVPALNPKEPEVICMKALRTKFRKELETSLNDNQKPTKSKIVPKSVKIQTRKKKQKARRIELIKLTKKYRNFLLPHFGNRLSGFGKCPKVSRNQIKEYLKSLGIIVENNSIGANSYKFHVINSAVNRARLGQIHYLNQLNEPQRVQKNSNQIRSWITSTHSKESQLPTQFNKLKFNDQDFPSLLTGFSKSKN